MKNLISGLLSIGLLFSAQLGLGQDKGPKESDVNTIAIFVDIPASYDGIDASHRSKLQSRVESLISANGLSGQGFSKTFAIQPKFEVYDEKIVEGMRTMTVIDAEIDLHVKNMINGVIYASYSMRLTGSGNSRKQAINNAIRDLPTRDAKISAFFDEAKSKIIDYYQKRCPDIIAKADAAIKSQRYEEAMVILMQVPEEAKGCYTEVLDKSVIAFEGWQQQNCKEQLQKAKASGAGNDYRMALKYLSRIDPSAPCAGDAEELMKEMALKVDADEKRDWDFAMRRYNDSTALQKARLANIKEISLAYFNSRPKEIHYHSLFGF